MALTQQQWFDKIKTYVPSWMVDRANGADTPISAGYFWALAKIAADAQTTAEGVRDDTFISRTSGTMIDQHGDERSIPRLSPPTEDDAPYALRVRTFATSLTAVKLKALVDALIAGISVDGCVIYETLQYGPYEEDGMYLDCDNNAFFSLSRVYNFFFIYIPMLDTDPGADLTSLYAQIVALLELNKAAGTSYDIYSQAGG